MFGRHFWGARFFGPRYWGDGGSTPPPTPAVCYLPSMSLMRSTAAAALGVMVNTTVPSEGGMTNRLPVMSEMRNATVAAEGAMSSAVVATEAELC